MYRTGRPAYAGTRNGNDQKAGVRHSVDESKSWGFGAPQTGHGIVAHLQSMFIEIATLVWPPRTHELQRFDDTTDFNPMLGVQQKTHWFVEMATLYSLPLCRCLSLANTSMHTRLHEY